MQAFRAFKVILGMPDTVILDKGWIKSTEYMDRLTLVPGNTRGNHLTARERDVVCTENNGDEHKTDYYNYPEDAKYRSGGHGMN